jgi:hypothetical protein
MYSNASENRKGGEKMKVKLFEFDISDFEEVYVIIDNKKNRIHISSVHYEFSITLDLNNLHDDLEMQTKYKEENFNNKVRKVCKKIIEELDL